MEEERGRGTDCAPVAMGVVGEEEDCVRPFFWVPDLGPPFTELLLLTCSCIRRGLRPAAGTWPLTGVAASVDAELLEGLTALPALSASCRPTICTLHKYSSNQIYRYFHRFYMQEYSKLYPDVLVMPPGGKELYGDNRLTLVW